MNLENLNSITIPVEPHVKRYLTKNLFLTGPYHLSTTDPFGPVIYQFLERKAKEYFPLRYNPDRSLEIRLGHNTGINYKIYMPAEKARKFNLFVDRMIIYELCKHLDNVRHYTKMEIRVGIFDFKDKYGFEEHEMTYEKCKKAYYRYRMRLESFMS